MTIQTDSELYRHLIDVQLTKVDELTSKLGIIGKSPEDRRDKIPGFHSAEFVSGYIYGLVEEVFKSSKSKSTAGNVMEEMEVAFKYFFNKNPTLLDEIKPYFEVSSLHLHLPEYEHIVVFHNARKNGKEDFDKYIKDSYSFPKSLGYGLLLHMKITENTAENKKIIDEIRKYIQDNE